MSGQRCSVDGCQKLEGKKRRGLCYAHYARWRVHGDFTTDGRRREVVSYSYMHRRIQQERGLAVDFLCVLCGDDAKEWSYKGCGQPEYVDKRGQSYSLNPDDYEPLCKSCHVKRDNQQGERHGMAKLDEEKILLIREQYSTGQVTQVQLAKLYGVSNTTISRVVRRKLWVKVS